MVYLGSQKQNQMKVMYRMLQCVCVGVEVSNWEGYIVKVYVLISMGIFIVNLYGEILKSMY